MAPDQVDDLCKTELQDRAIENPKQNRGNRQAQKNLARIRSQMCERKKRQNVSFFMKFDFISVLAAVFPEFEEDRAQKSTS